MRIDIVTTGKMPKCIRFRKNEFVVGRWLSGSTYSTRELTAIADIPHALDLITVLCIVMGWCSARGTKKHKSYQLLAFAYPVHVSALKMSMCFLYVRLRNETVCTI